MNAHASDHPQLRRPNKPARLIRELIANPWGRPRGLLIWAWIYCAWALLPVIIAIQFSFNSSRSLTVWNGFSTRWYWGDPYNSVWHNPDLQHALIQSLKLATLDMLVATPLGVLLALGLGRWRGLGSRPANFLMLFPLVTPELVMGVAMFLVFINLFTFISFGTEAQLLGHVTFSLTYVVIIVRGRLDSIGPGYEEAASDLGAGPVASFRLVLLPLLYPAIFASLMVVFAISIDDFVLSSWLSVGASSDTIPVVVYTSTRGSPLPSTNAIATIMVALSLSSAALGWVVYRFLTRDERETTREQRASMLGSR